MLKFNTIKAKLFWSLSAFAFIIISIIITFFVFESYRERLNNFAALTNQTTNLVKDVQILEDKFSIYETINEDFYKSKKSPFLKQIDEDLENLEKNIKILQNHEMSDEVIFLNAEKALKEIKHLRKAVNNLVNIILKKGFKDNGYIGKLRNYIHQIEDSSVVFGLSLDKILMVRRYEKDFLLRKQSKYVKKLNQAVIEVKKEVRSKITDTKSRSSMLELLYKYEATFLKVVKYDKKIGFNKNNGLRYTLNQSVNKVVNDVNNVKNEIILIAHRSKVRAKTYFVIFLGIFILLTIPPIFIITRRFGQPILHLSKSINDVIQNKFSEGTEIVRINTKDELSKISNDITLMLSKVRENRDEIIERQKVIKKAHDNIEKLSKIGQSITSNLTIQSISEIVHQNIIKLIKVTNIAIAIHDTEKGGLVFYGGKLKNLEIGFDDLEDANQLSVWCFKNNKPVFINDLMQEYQKYIPHISTVRNEEFPNSLIYLPLVAKEKVLGVITVQHSEKNIYKEYHLDILQNIAIYTAIALENAMIYQNLEIQKEKLKISELTLQQSVEEINATLELVQSEREKSDALLLNILPQQTAQELKEKGSTEPRYYELATVLFTDFKGFTKVAEKLSPQQLVQELDTCFLAFDEICEKHGLEKIKTIGDAYMCVGGLPNPNTSNPVDTVQAAIEILEWMDNWKKQRKEAVWEIRIGIHSGPLIAGIIGKKKFAYDIWGDTVNTASRMESDGEVGKINISETTYELVKEHFDCHYRGMIQSKNKGKLAMYFIGNHKEVKLV